MEFEVSFRETLRQLADAQTRLNNVGKILDNNTEKSGKMASAMGLAAAQMRRQMANLERHIEKNNLLREEEKHHIDAVKTAAERAFTSMAKGNVNATVKLQALNGELGHLQRLVKDTASKTAYTKWLQRTATLSAEAAGKTQFHITQLNHLSTAEGRAAVAAATLTQERVKSIREDTKAAAAAKALSDSHVQAYQRVLEAQKAARESSNAYLAIVNQLTNAEREMAVTGQRVAWGYERLTARVAELTAQQNAAKTAIDQANRAMVEGAANLERYTGANGRAEQAARALADQEARSAASRKAQMAELRKDIEERSRLREKEQTSYAQQANADAITQKERERARVLGQLRNAIEERFAADNKSASLVERLSRQEAEYQQRVDRVNTAIKLRNDLRRAEAAAATTLSSAEARLTQRIQAQTAEYQRRAGYMQMTNAQLLGLSASSGRVSRDMHINAQAAAMFRAGLGGLNASIGIYTSATVLAASATYAIASAFRTGLSAGMEFTETMARAEAVMMSSTSSVTAAGRSMEAVTMQVRALGASTLYTSTEVAGGLVDLGMAGLSASEAMTALSPSLNLAAIGSIEMSRAADIATNVMTSFDRSASDLGNVVDIMATAITNSNTNIEQLSNALSYVGPAAQAAGFGLEDTTAAIELLSNAGIKASRAGTGLRRFMLNIQNPTAKGTAVLERFGISIINAEGQTRSMTDILGQFNRALHNDVITPAERTSAIMDLVGVRAQSAVARMISSFEQFGVLRRQLEEVDGAAEKMRETMEDVLSMDWRQLKSAFQDIQLDVFTAYEESLRSFTAQARLSLMELQSVNEEMTKMVFSPEQIADGEFVTELDVLIAKFGEAIDVAKGLGFAFLAFKGGKVVSTTLGSLAANAQTAADRMAVLNARGALLNSTNLKLSATFNGLTGSMAAHYANIRFASSATERLTATMYSLSTAATYAARALTMVSAAFGWAGMVYGLYTAVTTLFGDDTADRIKEHGDNVEAAKARYKELQEQIDQTTEARQRLALVARREEAQKEAEGIELRLDRLRTTIELDIDQDSLRSVRDEIITLERRLADMRQQAIDAGVAIGQLGTNQLQFEQLKKSTGDMAFMLGDLRQATDNLTYSSANSNATLAEMASAAQEATNQSQKMRQGMGILSSVMALYSGRVQEVENSVRNYNVMMLDSIDVQRRAYEESQRFDNLSAQEKLNELLLKRSAIQLTLAAQVAAGADLGDDVFQRMQAQVAELTEGILEYGTEVKDSFETLAEKQIELEDLQRNEIETLETLEKKLQDVAVARMAMYAVAFTSGQDVNAEAMEELLDRQIELQQSWNQLNDRGNKSSSRTTRNQELEEAIRLHERLRGSYDALGLAADTLAEEQGKLDYLLGKGKISTEQHAQASAELTREYEKSVDPLSDIRTELYPVITAQGEYAERVGEIAEALAAGIISQEEATDAIEHYGKALEKVVEESDPLAKKLKELRDAYDSNYQRTQKLRKDLADINKLHREGAISGEQYARMWRQINDEMWDVAMEANPAAQEMARSWEEASNRIDETFADAFAGAFDSFDDFTDRLLDGFKRLLAELAYQATLKPIVVQFTQQMGGALGIPGYGAAPGMGQQPGGVGGFSLNSLNPSNWTSGVDTVKGWFGSGASATSAPIQGGFTSQIGGTGSYSGWAGSATGTGYGPAASGGGWMSTAGSMAQTAGATYAAYEIGSAIGDKISGLVTDKQANSSWGQNIGAAGGFAIGGPVGAGIGAAIGSVVDSLFGSYTPFQGEFVTRDSQFDATGYSRDDRVAAMRNADNNWSYYGGFYEQGAFGDVGFSHSGSQRLHRADGGPMDDSNLHERAEWGWKLAESAAAMDNLVASVARGEDEFRSMEQAVLGMTFRGGSAEEIFDFALVDRPLAALRSIGLDINDAMQSAILDLDTQESVTAVEQVISMTQIGNAIGGAVTDDIYSALNDFGGNLEGAFAWVDVSLQSLLLLENSAGRLNLQFDETAAGALGAASNIAQFAGGIDSLAALQSSYYQSYFSEAERAANLQDDLTASLSALGLELPASKEGFRALVEAQNLNTEAGQRNYASLLQLAGGFDQLRTVQDQLAASAENAAESVVDMSQAIRTREQLERQILQLQGDTTALREIELSQLQELEGAEQQGLIALQQRIWALQDAEEAERLAARAAQESARAAQELAREFDSLAAAAAQSVSNAESEVQNAFSQFSSQAFDIEVGLLELMGDELQIVARQREQELTQIDESLRPMQEKLWALQDESRAYESANQAANNYLSALDSVSSQLDSTLGSISQWTESQRSTEETPVDNLENSLAYFQRELELAQQGDRDALQGITSYADRLLTAGEAMYASSGDFHAIRDSILSELDKLPDVVSAEQFIADEIKQALFEQTQSLIEDYAENPSRIGSVLEPLFKAVEFEGDLVDYDQFASLFSGIASDDELRRIFDVLDETGDGTIDRLDWLNTSSDGTEENTDKLTTEADRQILELGKLVSEMTATTSQFVTLNSSIRSLRDSINALGVAQAEAARIERERERQEQAAQDALNRERALVSEASSLKSSINSSGVQEYQKRFNNSDILQFDESMVNLMISNTLSSIERSGEDFVWSSLGFTLGEQLEAYERALELFDLRREYQQETGRPAPFAKGGVFTNSIVSSPTLFDMGLMGEAGAEAIMPLKRHSDGSLGVRAEIPLPQFPLLGQSDVTQVMRDMQRTIEQQGKTIERLLSDSNTHLAAANNQRGAAATQQIAATKEGNKMLKKLQDDSRLEAAKR